MFKFSKFFSFIWKVLRGLYSNTMSRSAFDTDVGHGYFEKYEELMVPTCINVNLSLTSKKNCNNKEQLTYQHRKQWGAYWVMTRFILVRIQHKKTKNSTRKADTQLSKEQDNISHHIHLPDSKDVIHDQFCCNFRSLTEAFPCYSNLQEQ